MVKRELLCSEQSMSMTAMKAIMKVPETICLSFIYLHYPIDSNLLHYNTPGLQANYIMVNYCWDKHLLVMAAMIDKDV